MGSSGKRIYNSAAWDRVRKLKLSRTPLCEECTRTGRIVTADTVDHVVALKDGGAPFDLENLRSMCATCHNRKTSYVDGGFGHKRKTRAPLKGCDVNGMPLDPEHPWNRGGDQP